MTDKEQIIIGGKKKDCKILFRCKHIDTITACDMIRNGIKITPEKAPINDFELMLIENTDSPFGFSFVCKRNNKRVWEYSGFGHSGAYSIVTALLKQLARKTHECEELKEKYKEYVNSHNYNDAEFKQERDSLMQEILYKNRYRKALEEIEKYCKNISVEENLYNSRHFYNGGVTVEVVNEILDIINKAKGEGNGN